MMHPQTKCELSLNTVVAYTDADKDCREWKTRVTMTTDRNCKLVYPYYPPTLCKCLINNESPPKKQPEAKENNLQKCVIWKCLNVCIPYTIYETRQERKVKSCAAFNVHNYFVELSLYCITLGTSMVHLLPVSHETNCAISLLFYVFSFVSKCSFSLFFSFFFRIHKLLYYVCSH